jgi:hypothetical protein
MAADLVRASRLSMAFKMRDEAGKWELGFAGEIERLRDLFVGKL